MRGVEEFWICRRIGFNHIYKAGGTWMRENLKLMDGPCRCHARHCPYSINTIKLPAFVFTMVRNPVDRFSSAYAELVRRKSTNESTSRIPVDFSSFQLDNVLKTLEYGHYFDPHFKPQYIFMKNSTGHQVRHDMVVHIHRSGELIKKLQNITGVGWNFSFSNKQIAKRARKQHDLLFLDRKSTCRICNIYRTDYLLFNFSCPFDCPKPPKRNAALPYKSFGYLCAFVIVVFVLTIVHVSASRCLHCDCHSNCLSRTRSTLRLPSSRSIQPGRLRTVAYRMHHQQSSNIGVHTHLYQRASH